MPWRVVRRAQDPSTRRESGIIAQFEAGMGFDYSINLYYPAEQVERAILATA
jgi:hypothetical protein